MSPEDLQLRFRVATARPSHIDRDRDEALLALAEGAEQVPGVARFALSPTTALPNSPSWCEATGKDTGLATC